MWPWEHLAFGYALYSGYARLRYGRPPTDYPVVAVAVATQFPDLVDKPLAWSLDVLPTGRSLGHSVFVAAAVVTVVAAIARWRNLPAIGAAVAIGYLSHLLGDVLYPVLRGDAPTVGYLFWPLVRLPARDTPGLYVRTGQLLREFVTYLGTPDGRTYLALELGFVLVVIVLWIADGWPGLRTHR